jgi:hypothetical protein
VWDIASGKRVTLTPALPRGIDGEFGCVAYSPDGAWIATCAEILAATPIRIWDASSGELLCELPSKGVTMGTFAWTPDGTAIVRVGQPPLTAVDVATGKPVREFRVRAWLGLLQEATPDGKYSVFLSNQAVYLFPMPAPKKPAPPKAELTAAELDALWADASSENKIRQAQIRRALTAAPGSAVPYLAKRVPVATAADVDRVRKLIAELDADAPDARKSAQDRLAAVAQRFEDVLRAELPTAPAGEIKNRLTFLLGDLAAKPLPDDLKADLRAIELLKMLNTPAATKHLTALAAGVPQARVTKDAKKALERAP